MDPVIELETFLNRWSREVYGNSDASPVPIITSIAELLERETENYLKLPIDPFDERHPSRAYPDSTLGALLKTLFKNDSFMSEITNSYLTSGSDFDLQVASCRLLIDALPGLDPAAVFVDPPTLIGQMVEWAERSEFPLHAYATPLLAAIMEVPGLSANYRQENTRLVPIMFNRLYRLTHGSDDPLESNENTIKHNRTKLTTNGFMKRQHSSDEEAESTKKPKRLSPVQNECSSSSWAEAYMSGSYQMWPLNTVMQQRFILQYLASLGEYQELLEHMFEYKAISYILQFIDRRKNPDVRLAFDALKFCAAFLTHKEFALKFLEHDGLPRLLKVSKHGMASAGVSLCLSTLAYHDDVMEAICWMDENTVKDMVSYGLWSLECSHDSNRVQAAMFFSLCFQFPILLELFDQHDGLRKLLNVLSMHGLLNDDPGLNEMTDDEKYFRRQTAKQVTLALKRYARAHFIRETRKQTRASDPKRKPIPIRADESLSDPMELHLQQAFPTFNWHPVDRIVQSEGLMYLLKLIIHFWNEGFWTREKKDIIKNVLEILAICSLSPKVQRLLLKVVIRTPTYPPDHPAISVVVMCTDFRNNESDCMKSALNVLINLSHAVHVIRAPPPILNDSITSSGRKRPNPRSIDISSALKKAIWNNNGSYMLPKLLTITSPLTEADKIRALTCRVLCGLAKDESIRQTLGKQPLFTNGQLQSLMKEPILPDKRIEHASFCKYCEDLIHLVTGVDVSTVTGVEPSSDDIRRRRIVNKTRINYDKEEVLYLIYKYLRSEGQHEAAAKLSETAKFTLKPSIKYAMTKGEDESQVTLESILTSYLRSQHSQCKNPVALCPPFKLLEPHKCPEPTNRLSAPLNIVKRILRRRIFPPSGGFNGAKYDRQYVYSKFRPYRLVRDPLDTRTSSTCCAFSTDGQFLFVGTDDGTLKAFNINSGVMEASYECHVNEIGYIEASKDDNLILTTSPDSPSPQCLLWNFNEVFDRKHRFDNDLHAEFGKASSDRVVSTQELYARLWDTETSTVLQKFDSHHRYTCNRATMNYDDTLVLNDGVLWDIRAPRVVHKFQKFNERINGIFHPNGNEIICNSHIWDVRNFRNLRTVPAFDMCQLKFNDTGEVIFSIILDDQSDGSGSANNEFRTSFRTFDSYDYSTISTVDIKRTITDLAISKGDRYVALVESSEKTRPYQDEAIAESNICRLYEVGRSKYDPNIDLDDEDESVEDEEGDDDDDDDDVDDDDDDDEEVDGEDFVDYDDADYEDIYEYTDDGEHDDSESGGTSDSRLSSSAASHDEIISRPTVRFGLYNNFEDDGSGEDDSDPSFVLEE